MTDTDDDTREFNRQFEFRAEPSDDGLTLEGYAAVFNSPTMIESWAGTFEETIIPGAFTRSIGMRTPILMFDHGRHPLIGDMPLGVIRSLKEDDKGLRVRARLSDNWLVQPVRDAIRDGAISGMSFRFEPVKQEWSSDRRSRKLIELAVPELGPTALPAYDGATVGVRSRDTLLALADPDVRAEIARILISGTDLRSLADVTAPASSHAATPPTDPARSHSEETRQLAVIQSILTLKGAS